jgi:hypothetical protein
MPSRDLRVLFILGLVVCGLTATLVPTPGYMDAYYYFGGARQLARGRGFTEPYVWNYLLPFQALPIPSHLYWMPLTSLVVAPALAWAGETSVTVLFQVAQAPMVVLAALLPLLTYRVAFTLTSRRGAAWVAAVFTLTSAYYLPYWPTTDAFALYGLVAGGALILVGQPPNKRTLFLAGICAGLTHLTRADGVLVVLTLLVVVLLAILGRPHRSPSAFLLPASSLVLGYLLIMLPWFLRNVAIIGSPLAPGGARTLWLTQYDDLFLFDTTQLTWAHYWASGWVAIVQGKWSALMDGVGTFIGPLTSIVGFPFAVVGLWRLRHHVLYRSAWLYGAALFGAMILVFTFPGARGGLFHSGAALLPFIHPAIVIGVEASVDAVARRLKHWQPEKSKPIFLGLVLGLWLMLALGLAQRRLLGPERQETAQVEAAYVDIGQWLADVDPTAIVAVNNPPGFYYFTQHAAIVIPNEAETVVATAMHTFGARWLVLDANHPKPLAPLYTSPTGAKQFHLRATFGAPSQPIYLLEMITP